jgi:protein gp37
MFSLWKTVRETPHHVYQQHKLSGKRRAMPRVADAGEPYHVAWLKGGEFRKTRGPKA